MRHVAFLAPRGPRDPDGVPIERDDAPYGFGGDALDDGLFDGCCGTVIPPMHAVDKAVAVLSVER